MTLGVDTYCVDSLRTGRLASELELVAQNAYHRLITPRGMLRGGDEEEDYGLDLASKIGSATPDADAAALPGQIRSELLKDRRIVDVTATVQVERAGPKTSYTIKVHGQTGAGPFDLVLAVSGVTTTLLKISTGGST